VEGGPVSGKAGEYRKLGSYFPRKSESMQAPFCAALPLCLKSVGLLAIGGQNGPEHVSRHAPACPHLRRLAGVKQLYQRRGSLPADVEEAGSVEGASMLADDIADRIAIACPVELDGIIKDMWLDHTHGLLADNEMETLDEAARARREAFQERRQAARPGGAPRGRARRGQRSPDKQASIERRRRLVASGPLPPPLAARFTWGEIAVMRIVGDECRVHGCCTLHIDAIAARSGVHRTTVQNALREAQGRDGRPGIITVQERRRRGQRSLTNIIRIVSRGWPGLAPQGPIPVRHGGGFKMHSNQKIEHHGYRFISKGKASLGHSGRSLFLWRGNIGLPQSTTITALQICIR
jgi:hypothetical protein